MLKPGDKAPEFNLPNQDGEYVSLPDLLTNGPLILYFYPADFTLLCTRQACELEEKSTRLKQANLNVVGISPQGVESHHRFAETHELYFALLADTDKSVIKKYGAMGPLKMGVRRISYLIDRDAIIRDSLLADFRLSRHRHFVDTAIALHETDSRNIAAGNE